MNGLSIGIGIGFWALIIGLAFYSNHRRRNRWGGGGGQPMPPPQAGSFGPFGPAPGGVEYGTQPPFNSPPPQRRVVASPFLLLKTVAPTRPTKILLAVAALLGLAGVLIMILGVRAPDAPSFLPLVFSGAGLCFVAGFIWAGLLIATTMRQRRRWQAQGWPAGDR